MPAYNTSSLPNIALLNYNSYITNTGFDNIEIGK